LNSQANQNHYNLEALVKAILAKDDSQIFEYQAISPPKAIEELALAIQIADIIQAQNCDFATAQKLLNS
jgi:Holliday junction resolvase RusA-like endonuclease